MPREKRDVKELRTRAINSVVIAIEMFNRPHEIGRCESVLILLHHSLEMLAKSIVKDKTGCLHGKDQKFTYSFSKSIDILKNELKLLDKSEYAYLSILDTHRDTAMHYYQDVSEDVLYVLTQAGVTLFDDILNRVFSVKLSDYIPSRVLPVSAKPPKDLALLVDSEFAYVDSLLEAKNRKGIQAASRLRSLMALAITEEGGDGRISDVDLYKAIRDRRRGVEWNVLFPEIAQLKLSCEGEGMQIALRIKKEGVPVRIAKDGEDAAIVQYRDWFDKYNLSLNDIAVKVGLTGPKLRAYMFELNIWSDPESYSVKRVNSQEYKRYTKKTLDAVRMARDKYTPEEMWEKHKVKVLNRKVKEENDLEIKDDDTE